MSLIFILFSFSVYSVDITNCGVFITPNTVYNITTDITNTSYLCLNFQSAASNITIDGLGHTLWGNYNTTTSYGVFLGNGGNNATIRNLTVNGYDYPIYKSSYGNVTVNNVTLGGYGRTFPSSVLDMTYNNITVYNTTFTRLTTVLQIYYMNYVTIKNSMFNTTGSFAVFFYNSTNLSFVNCTSIAADKTNNSGIVLNLDWNVSFYNNIDLNKISFSNLSGLTFVNNTYNNVTGYVLSSGDFNTQRFTDVKINDNKFFVYNYSTGMMPLFDVVRLEMKNNIFGNATNPLQFNDSSTQPLSFWSLNNALIRNNSFYIHNYTYGIYVRGNSLINSSNITIDSNYVKFNYDANSYGLTCGNDDIAGSPGIFYIYNCTVSNNIITAPYSSTGRHMVIVKFTKNGKVFNNKITNGGYNFVIKDNTEIDFYNNTMVNGTFGTLHVKGTSNSTFHNNIFLNNSNGIAIFIWWDNLGLVPGLNNTFYDMDLSVTNKCPQIAASGNASTSNNFINVTISNRSCISVSNGTTSGNNLLNYNWYYNFNTNKPVSVNIKDKNNNTVYQANNVQTVSTNLREFSNNDGLITDYNNYTSTITYGRDYIYVYNLTVTKNIFESLTINNTLNPADFAYCYNTRSIVYSAFALIAVLLIAASAFLVVSLASGNANGPVMIMTLTGFIGLAIVLMIGYIVIGNVSNLIC